MTLHDFCKYLTDTITDDMFEALVLLNLQKQYPIISCTLCEHSHIKIYTLLTKIGNQIFLAINPDNIPLDTSVYTEQNCMNAIKTSTNLFYLACKLYNLASCETPSCLQELRAFVTQMNNYPVFELGRPSGTYFASSIDDVVDEICESRKKTWRIAFDQYMDAAIALLEKQAYAVQKRRNGLLDVSTPDTTIRLDIQLFAITGRILTGCPTNATFFFHDFTEDSTASLFAAKMLEFVQRILNASL